ncbi:HlyD family secretion protein [Bradyrhizobium sp. Ec3.3]|uniref:HlyD family secretion protein n=1 Tax=Bradyrhizobium sp. Ec3.3 TaxID=189753 RepID=UPI0003F6EC18|nr:HlyD family secretion protein [Bradyrhizobium sp. Ec3.3]
MKPIVKVITTGVIVLTALGMITYKYLDYVRYPWTRDGLVRAQVVQVVPRVSGALVQVPIQNNQLVKKGDLLFEIDPRTFQATVNLARAQLDNMRDIIKSLTEQVDVMRDAVSQSESARNEARFEVEGYAANTENARVELERTKTLLDQGVTDQRDYDNKNTTYLEALAKLNGAKAQVNQATAELERSKDALARSIADLGTPGVDNPRLRRASADLEIAQLNLDFTKVYAPTDGYVTNLQLHVGDSVVANQATMAVIDANSFYVQAFFRETFVGNFEKGDRAVVTLMSYPSTPLEASVESIGWGIAQQNGSTGYELLPSVQPTFEWIRLAQRIPVIVRIEKLPDNIKLRAGTTASVVVITGTSTNADRVPAVPRPLQ